MELGERKLKILNAIIETYIQTGEPIASKSLCDKFDFAVSSATIRNEMAELAELGILKQLHTSSGRVPSQLGYRIYVNKLMQKIDISDHDKNRIINSFMISCDSLEHVIENAAQAISNISGLIALSVTPSFEDSLICGIEIVKINNHIGMIIILTTAGISKSKNFVCDYNITPEILRIFKSILNEKLIGLKLTQINPAFVQTLAASLGEMSLLMSPLLVAIMDSAINSLSKKIFVYGRENILFLPEFNLSNTRKIIKFLNDTSNVEKILKNNKNLKSNIFIGNENHCEELKEFSLIISNYIIKNNNHGTIGVITPMRVDYSKILSIVEYITSLVEKLINKMYYV